jgi:hypothetical protein
MTLNVIRFVRYVAATSASAAELLSARDRQLDNNLFSWEFVP